MSTALTSDVASVRKIWMSSAIEPDVSCTNMMSRSWSVGSGAVTCTLTTAGSPRFRYTDAVTGLTGKPAVVESTCDLAKNHSWRSRSVPLFSTPRHAPAAVGPMLEPARHVPSDTHQPQPERAKHAVHDLA